MADLSAINTANPTQQLCNKNKKAWHERKACNYADRNAGASSSANEYMAGSIMVQPPHEHANPTGTIILARL